MTAVVLDAGALIGVDRNERAVVSLLAAARSAGLPLRTVSTVVAQVWRDERGRQAHLARFLRAVEIVPVDDVAARTAGVLLGRSETSDVVDATLVAAVRRGDQILTSDRSDIAALLDAARLRVEIVDC
jgi:predicted nucleic acid-binding protein